MSLDTIEMLYRERPVEGLTVARLLGQAAAQRVRAVNQRFEEHLFADQSDPVVDAMVARAVAAQRAFASWEEKPLDALLHDIAKTVADHADELAAATIAETGIGRVDDKAEKILFGELQPGQQLEARVAPSSKGLTAVELRALH